MLETSSQSTIEKEVRCPRYSGSRPAMDDVLGEAQSGCCGRKGNGSS